METDVKNSMEDKETTSSRDASSDLVPVTIKKKIFNDPIHGPIELHELLVAIIDTPEFQRLRRLLQLGTVHYVFPGACHRRFEHSIGTCYLAGEMLKHLRENQINLNITEKDILCVQIAALCHDLGHGPFSHLFEYFVNEKNAADPHFQSWKHEQASREMFTRIVMNPTEKLKKRMKRSEIDDYDLSFIKHLIHKDPTDILSDYYKSKLYLCEIVSNEATGIDVDKFDYIARDAYYLGIKVSFQYMRFIKFCRVMMCKNDNGNNEMHICLRDKEFEACYELYRVRDQLYRLAYHHPVVRGINLLMKKAFNEADKTLTFGDQATPLSETVKNMNLFVQVDDDILTLIRQSPLKSMKNAQDILRRIEIRDLYQYIGNVYISSEDLQKSELIKQAFKKAVESAYHRNSNRIAITEDDFVMEKVKFSWGHEGKSPIENMWFYRKLSDDRAEQLFSGVNSVRLPKLFLENELRFYYKKRDEADLSEFLTVFQNAFPQKN